MAESDRNARLYAPFRFSMRQMLIWMAVIAAMIPLGGFVLRNASTWVGPMTLLATGCVLAASACLALNRLEASRAFWAGFAIFGTMYFVLAGDPFGTPYSYHFITEEWSDAAYERWFGPAEDSPPFVYPPPIPSPVSYQYAETPAAESAEPSRESFLMIAHMLWTFVFAIAGGWLSVLIYATGRPQPRKDQRSAADDTDDTDEKHKQKDAKLAKDRKVYLCGLLF